MDFFYDGQIRRYVTQFMRIFIGFKYKAGDGEERQTPVAYGDLSRQVAAIIRENSENKLPTVPRISCYITGLSLDTTRLSDPTFISKISVRERAYESGAYQTFQGGGYTVERLMPTPYKLEMKCDIWTSNTDQKLQLLEQILVMFSPSLEIQTTDNYLDWTSLSVVYLSNTNFSSRQIPAGTESEIDICTLTFEMPIHISPPAKVKKLGVVKTIINNVFGEDGSIVDLNTLIYNQNESNTPGLRLTIDNNEVLLMKGPEGTGSYDYYLTFTNPPEGDDWRRVLDLHGGYTTTSLIHFLQPTGYEVTGTFEVNQVDPTILVVTLDSDTIPTNTLNPIDRIVDPFNFNPVVFFGGRENIPVGTRYLIVDNILVRENYNHRGNWKTNTVYYVDDVVYYKNQNYICAERHVSAESVGLGLESDSTKWNIIRNPSIPETAPDSTTIDSMLISRVGADAWQNFDSAYAAIKANSIIEWTGEYWAVDFDPDINDSSLQYMQNIKTGVQYTWNGEQWLKSFEGEYAVGYWRLELDA